MACCINLDTRETTCDIFAGIERSLSVSQVIDSCLARCKLFGLEGVVYKEFDTAYEGGKQKCWKKFKHERETVDAVVVGSECGKKGTKFEGIKVVFRLAVIGDDSSLVPLCSVLVGSTDIASQIDINMVVEIKYY